MSTRNSKPVTLDDLEFQSDRLVKVRGMRPEYMGGLALIALVRDLASALRSLPVVPPVSELRKDEVCAKVSDQIISVIFRDLR